MSFIKEVKWYNINVWSLKGVVLLGVFHQEAEMTSSKIISLALIFAVGIFVCTFTTACNNERNQNGISITKESRFKDMQKQESKNPKIVYLGADDNYEANVDFGPKDVSFDMKSLR